MGSLEINQHPIHPAAWRFENHVAKSANKRKIEKVCDRTELGDYDVDLRQDDGWAAEFDADTLFGRDPRTGRFAVRGLAGMTRLLACKRDGVLVTVSSIWGTSEIGSAFREAAAAQYLALQTRQAGPLVVVRWTDPARRTADCGDVPAF